MVVDKSKMQSVNLMSISIEFFYLYVNQTVKKKLFPNAYIGTVRTINTVL